MTLRNCVVACLLPWLVGPPAASAAGLLDLSLEQLLELRVEAGTRVAQRAADLPSTLRVLTAADIRTFGYRTLAEALAGMPGMFGYSDGNYDYIGMRGMLSSRDYNSRFLLLIDGQRVTDSIFDGASVGREALLDIELVERIEVIPGPGAAAYGGNAIFGVINVVTRGAASIGGVELSGSVGSDRSFGGRASLGRSFDNGASLVLSASRYGSAGSDRFYPEYVDSNVADGVADGVARGADREGARSLFAKLRQGGFDLTAAWTERLKGIPTGAWGSTFGDVGTRTADGAAMLALHYAGQLDRDWSLDARALLQQSWYNGTYLYPETPDSVQIDMARGRRAGLEATLSTRRFAGHNLAIGAETVIDYRQEQGAWYDPGAVDFWRDRGRARRVAAFVTDEITLDPQLLINAGLRVDRHSDAGGFVSPRLGVVWRLDREQVLKATAGQAFKAPSAMERNYAPPGYALNPDLRSEGIRNLDLGWERRPADGWRSNVVLHAYRISDFVDVRPDPVTGDFVASNVPELRGHGLEVDLEREWRGGWRVRAGASAQRTWNAASGSRVVNSPNLLGRLQLVAPLPRGLRLALDASYVGGRPAIVATAPAYWLANLNLTSAPVDRGFEWSAGIYNLFDRVHHWPGSDEHRQNLLPQDGRSFRLQGVLRF